MTGAPFFMARSTTLTVFWAKRSREIPVGLVPVLREQVDVAAVDLAVAGHDAVDQHVKLHEAPRIEQCEHTLARAQELVLAPSRRLLGPPFEKGLLLQQTQPLQSLLAGHDGETSWLVVATTLPPISVHIGGCHATRKRALRKLGAVSSRDLYSGLCSPM